MSGGAEQDSEALAGPELELPTLSRRRGPVSLPCWGRTNWPTANGGGSPQRRRALRSGCAAIVAFMSPSRRFAMLVAVSALVTPGGAVGQEGAPPSLDLGVTQARNGLGQSVVSSWMQTRADRDSRVTVYRLRGRRGCVSDPRLLWPGDSEQLIFDFTPRAGKWSRVVRSVEATAGTWTYCGYVVNEGATRFGFAYVVDSLRRTFRLQGSRPGSPPFTAGSWSSCPAPGRGIVSLRVRRRGDLRGACRDARLVSIRWRGAFQDQAGGARNNWTTGWLDSAGRLLPRLNHPAVRRQQVRVPSLRATYGCLERAAGRHLFETLSVQCGGVMFAYTRT